MTRGRLAGDGLSLLETIISFFIIIGALLIMVQLFHSSLHHATRTKQRATGGMLAQEKLEEMRAWASKPDNYEGSWVAYDDVEAAVPGFPGFTVKTRLVPADLPSPCTLLEDNHPLLERRIITAAGRWVTVECWWGSGAAQRVKIVSLIGAPPRAFRSVDPVVIEGAAPAPPGLPHDSPGATFTAKAFDQAGNELTGATFHWYVLPKTGNATVSAQSRDGKSGTVSNYVLRLDGSPDYTGGTCLFAVKARYDGRTEYDTVEVLLQP